MPDDEQLPDPAEVAAYLSSLRGPTLDEQMCRWGARYILAGLELALHYQRHHPSEGRSCDCGRATG